MSCCDFLTALGLKSGSTGGRVSAQVLEGGSAVVGQQVERYQPPQHTALSGGVEIAFGRFGVQPTRFGPIITIEKLGVSERIGYAGLGLSGRLVEHPEGTGRVALLLQLPGSRRRILG
jgi:hypothetical protein